MPEFRNRHDDVTERMNNLIEGYRPDDWIERFNDGRWSWIVFTDDLRILYERQDSNMIIFWKE